MSFEDRIIRGIDRNRERRLELSPLMKRAHEKAIGILKNPEYAIQETEFKAVYGDTSVKQDIATADRLESRFRQTETIESRNLKQVAETLEALMLEQSEMSNWLGNAQTLKASRFDDYVNKVDMIAEWNTPTEGSRVLALGVDVTFGTMGVKKKIEAIREEIMRGRLGSIRYFKDTRGDFMGTRNNVPRTVIGISAPEVEKLSGLWLSGEKKALGSHPIQSLIVEEVYAQLEAMRSYAKSCNKSDIEGAYDQAISIIKPLRVQKAPYRTAHFREDPVANEIFAETRNLFRL